MTALEHDIQETRAHLGETVDALAAMADAGKKRAGIVALIGVAAVAALVLWRRLS
ncbi:DUF3618 domain-containing protein [Aeromicrobium ginsengisoli]|uniref:DUF3618 domain-containing protein n=1 Tax=Aeromicrobium ginsengisoli TaxID=363867 RepID=A0A5M4FBT8_9ACTN|nr:DUF3618 domain-containing protein [Aeromicrobium ginsengisoli]KAA1395731.1 DUF3618 domain-containing protein [Aeromicrobium ginsengisoli]